MMQKRRKHYNFNMIQEKMKHVKDQTLQKNMRKVKQFKSLMEMEALINNNKSNIVQYLRKQGEKDSKNELSNALSEAIVKDKPNVKWTDIAGLEAAKSAL